MLLTLTFSMVWNWIWQERPSQLLTLSIPLLKRVLEVMVMLMLSFLKVPDPGAQADRSSEPEMDVSQVVPEVRTFSTHTGRFHRSGFDQCSRYFHTTCLCDESPSSIFERSTPFSHEDSSVGDHKR